MNEPWDVSQAHKKKKQHRAVLHRASTLMTERSGELDELYFVEGITVCKGRTGRDPSTEGLGGGMNEKTRYDLKNRDELPTAVTCYAGGRER